MSEFKDKASSHDSSPARPRGLFSSVLCGRCILLLLLTSVLGVFVYKLIHTPEWVVLTGSEDERQEICRSVYRKSPKRAAWCLRRLLSDPAPGVRITAIGALAYCPDLHPRFRPRIDDLTDDANLRVRARALEFLYQHAETIPDAWRTKTRALLEKKASRNEHPQLLSFYLSDAAERGDEGVVAWVLELLQTHELDSDGNLQPLLDHPTLLAPHRKRLVQMLKHADERNHGFLLAALTAIDGQMRGTKAADWQLDVQQPQSGTTEPAAVERFTTEAEWAHRIQPNFEISREEGALCLLLGEGAGGEHFWRRHSHTSVDIGKASFSFTTARSQRYQIWVHCWFSDKCGNHSLLHIDNRWLQWRQAGEDDRSDALRVWHWKRLETNVALPAGRHTLQLTAGDDGLLYDKLAILPVGETFDPQSPPPLHPLYDPAIPSFISFTPDTQAQSRGTTQTLTVSVRRNSPEIDDGTLTVQVPAPFRIIGESTVPIRFAPASPLAQAAVHVHLPDDAVSGEVVVSATFQSQGRELAAGSFILGTRPQWLTTGPLDPDDPRCQKLQRKTCLEKADLEEGWVPYPDVGHDRYRRLTFESAYGQMHHKTIFLYTEIEVTKDCRLNSYLTIDDCGFVFVDGKQVAGRRQEGVGEGWLLVQPCQLSQGRHQVFVWVYQANFPEPEGPHAGRHTPNHWNFKWLLREDMHRPATTVKTVPLTLAK